MYERLLLESGKVFDGSRISSIGAKVIDDTQDITIPVIGEGKAVILEVIAPSNFTPDVAFVISVEIRNDGEDDYMFIIIKDRYTGDIVAEKEVYVTKGKGWLWLAPVTLIQTTDFHGTVMVGHVE